MPIICIDNHSLQYKLRRSLRAKRLHIVYREPAFEIVAPSGVLNQAALRFLFTQKHWMLRQHTKRQKEIDASRSVWPEAFLPNEPIPYRGEVFQLQLKYGRQSRPTLLAPHNSLIMQLDPRQISGDTLEQQVKRCLKDWYVDEARHLVEAAITRFAPFVKRWPTGFSIKQQKTRWGSCGTNNKIHINWLLVCAPPGVLEYVVVHELCHLWHRNHGKRFWKKVASVLPDYEIYDKWLTQPGRALLYKGL